MDVNKEDTKTDHSSHVTYKNKSKVKTMDLNVNGKTTRLFKKENLENIIMIFVVGKYFLNTSKKKQKTNFTKGRTGWNLTALELRNLFIKRGFFKESVT